MKPEVLEAIRGSVAKWEGIVNGSGVDEGVDNCPLCAMFYEGNCDGCPVRAKTKLSGCKNTPIEVWRQLWLTHFRKDQRRFYAETPISLEIAKAVVQFLKNLLEDYEHGRSNHAIGCGAK